MNRPKIIIQIKITKLMRLIFLINDEPLTIISVTQLTTGINNSNICTKRGNFKKALSIKLLPFFV